MSSDFQHFSQVQRSQAYRWWLLFSHPASALPIPFSFTGSWGVCPMPNFSFSLHHGLQAPESSALRRTRQPLPPVTLTAGTKGSLWSVLRCVLIVRHSTNGLLVCGQKRKAIYLLSSLVFWQQLRGSCLRGMSRPRRGNRDRRLTHHTR